MSKEVNFYFLVFTVLLIFLIYFLELVSRTCSSHKLDIKFRSLNIYVLKFNDCILNPFG